MKVDFANYVLWDDAMEWWTRTCVVKFEDREEKEWGEFKDAFMDKYFPRDEFRQLVQGNLLVIENATTLS